MTEHVGEVIDDTVTNPVEQAKKRARTQTRQGGFLVSDEAALSAKGAKPALSSFSAGKTFQDEQIDIYRGEVSASNSRSDDNSSKKLHEDNSVDMTDPNVDIEQASDDDQNEEDLETEVITRRRRKGRVDKDYKEGEGAEDDPESSDAPLDELEPENLNDPELERRMKKL